MKTYNCWVTVYVGEIEAESKAGAEQWAVDTLADDFLRPEVEAVIETVDVEEVEP